MKIQNKEYYKFFNEYFKNKPFSQDQNTKLISFDKGLHICEKQQYGVKGALVLIL